MTNVLRENGNNVSIDAEKNYKAMFQKSVMSRLSQKWTEKFNKFMNRSSPLDYLNTDFSISRGKMPIILVSQDGKSLTLSPDFEEARNQITQFYFRDENATFQNLAANDQNKIISIMCLLSPKVANIAINAPMQADKNEISSYQGFVLNQSSSTEAIILHFDEQNNIELQTVVSGKVKSFTDSATNQEIQLGEGSEYKGGFTCALDHKEIDRISEQAMENQMISFDENLDSFDFNFETDFK